MNQVFSCSCLGLYLLHGKILLVYFYSDFTLKCILIVYVDFKSQPLSVLMIKNSLCAGFVALLSQLTDVGDLNKERFVGMCSVDCELRRNS